MKILIAPDSFKGTMRSGEVGDIIAAAVRRVLPNAEIVMIPMADGGEGTTDAVVRATGGEERTVLVRGPLSEPTEACFGLLPGGRTAVMEMASASGIELLHPSRLDPLCTTTFGTGELIRAALHSGVGEIILGIGGSATVDGGTGMAQALGYRLLDADGRECAPGGGTLEAITAIDATGVDPTLRDCRIRVACDVTNPLLGKFGAATVFGPQKGATPAMVARLEAGLANLTEVWIRDGLLTSVMQPGDGAAGGVGAGLRAFCGAEMSSGAELVAEIAGFDREIRDADILITGEGRTDEQTAHGKLCAVLAGKAKASGVKTILLSGTVAGDQRQLLEMFDCIFATAPTSADQEWALENARENLAVMARRVAELLCEGRL